MTKDELLQRIAENHKSHAADSDQVEAMNQVRYATRECARDLVRLCPVGRELLLALTALEEAMFWANAGIARSGADADDG